MSTFGKVAEGLRVPHPARARLLREMAGDLGGLARELEARGWSPDAARRRAEEVLLPEGPALEALVRLHVPPYQRLRPWERRTVAALTLFSAVAALVAVARSAPLGTPSPFLVPVVVLGTAAVGAGLAKAFRLFVVRDHRVERLRAGLSTTLGLAVATPLAALAGAVADLRTLAARMVTGPPDPVRTVSGFLHRDATLLAAGLALALLAGLLWLLLVQWVAAVESFEAGLAHDGAPDPFPSIPEDLP